MEILHSNSIPVSTDGISVDQAYPNTGFETFFHGFRELPEILDGDAIIIPDSFPRTRTRRLVVLVPGGEVDASALARRIWGLAISSGLNILYLTLAPDELQVAYLRFRLAGLASMTSFRDVQSQVLVSLAKSWLEAVRQNLQLGDLLVCMQSHTIPVHGLWRKPLGQYFAETLSVPVYVIAGLKVKKSHPLEQWGKEILAWLASLSLLVIFFSLQAEIVKFIHGTSSTILFSFLAIVEVFVIYRLNEWIG